MVHRYGHADRPDHAAMSDAQLDHFCDVIIAAAAPMITVGDALQSFLTVEAIRQSIATEKTVTLRDLASHRHRRERLS